MTLFQIFALTLLGALVVREGVLIARGTARWPGWLVRVAVWLSAALTIAVPNLVQTVASAVGIGRGADVVLYLFVLAFLGTSFYFYACYAALERQITELLRCQAIEHARRGSPDGYPATDPGISLERTEVERT